MRVLPLLLLFAGCGTESTDSTDPPCLLSEMTITPTTLDFERVQIGHSATLEVEVRNTGCFAFELLRVEPQVGSAPGFSLGAEVPPQTIRISQAVTLPMQFTPAVPGDNVGRWDVVTDLRTDSTQTIDMTGTGF